MSLMVFNSSSVSSTASSRAYRPFYSKLLTLVNLTIMTAVLSATAPARSVPTYGLTVQQPVFAAGVWNFFSFLGFGSNSDDDQAKQKRVRGGSPFIESKPDPDNPGNPAYSYKPDAAPCGPTGVTRTVGPTGQFQTIQAAINASSFANRDTIQVAPGTYTEQLIVNKCVNIVGGGQTGANATLIQSPATLAISSVPSVSAYSVVEVRSNATVTMSNLTVTGPVNLQSDPAATLYGIFVVENAALIMTDATITKIRQEPIQGNQTGIAVRAGSVSFNQTGSLDFTRVTVSDYQKGGIIVSNSGSTGSIKDSLIQGVGATPAIGQNGIQINDGATATITNNTISGNVCDNVNCSFNTYYSYGILALETGNITISGNTFDNNDAGIYNLTPGFTSTINGNTLNQVRYSGFDLDAGTANVSNNFINGSAFGPVTGIGVLSYTGDTVNTIANLHSNSITGASQAGISVDDFDTSDAYFPVVMSSDFNRIAGNVIGIDNNTTSSTVSQTNNFWGCNQGPNGGTGCDTTDGLVNTSTPYLRLSHTPPVTQPSVGAGGTTTITTNLRFNSAGTDTFTAANHLPNPIPATASSANSPNGIPVNFTATNGTVNPTVTPLVDGLASSVFTGGTVDGGDQTAVVTAKVDNATDTFNVTVLDSKPPTVLSANVTSSTATTVTYTVVFSEAVTGVDATDFTVTTTGNVAASVTNVSGTGNTRTVTVTVSSGMGTVQLNVIDNDSIVDTAGTPNPLNGAGNNPTFAGQTANVDVQMPTVTINQAAAQPDPTSSSPINFTVVFSEPVTGFDGSDVVFTGSTAGGNLTATVTGSGATYNVAVSGMTTSGTVVASIPANAAVDSANNGNAASMSTDNSVTYLAARVTRLRDNVTFATIQGGIDDAGTVSGDTLLASSGVYNERIVVNKSITIQGAQHGVLAKPRNDLNAESTIVVDNSQTLPVDIREDNVTIDGFNFDINQTFPTATTTDKPSYIILANSVSGAASDGYQNLHINYNRLAAAAGYEIVNPAIDRRAIGIATAVDCVIEGNYVANYPSQSVTISDGSTNLIYRNNDSFNAVDASITLQSNFRNPAPQRRHINYLIENNRFVQDGMLLFLSQGGTIRNNTFTQAPGEAGILMLGGNDAVNISSNTFTLSNRQAMLSKDSDFGFGQDSNINFIGNTITRPSDAGTTGSFGAIDYRGTGGTNTIADNTLQITGTLPAGNSTYGIRLRGSASGNFNITGNFLDGNGVASTGTTVSTAGLYITSNNPGTVSVGGDGPGNLGQIPTSAVLNINCNTFRQFQNGIIVFDNGANTTGGLPTGIDVNANGDNFLGNSLFGINNGGTSETIDATNSYWNSPSGPTNPNNPGGTGDAVSANVNYTPFLTSPSMCAPMNAVPAAQTINQDTTLTFSSANGNQISVADPDVLNNPVTVMLSVTNGTLTLSQTTGLTVTGNGTGNVTFSGTLAAVNAALNGLTFTPNAGFVGTSTLTITSSSMGSPGVGGGTQTDTDTVTINVLDAVAPTVTITQGSNQSDPTSTSPITFDVVFSETVTGFDASDVVVTGSAFGTGVTPTVTVTGSGATYTVTVSGMTRSGTVRATIPAGAAIDAQGNQSTASTSTDNTVFFNFVAVNPTTVIQPVNPVNIMAQQFAFLNEGATGSGAFVTGPATPPGGIGSAQLTVDGTGRENLVTARYGGTRLADISALRYSAYTNRNDNLTITLQFDVDYDLTDANYAYQNRLVYEPAAQGITVAPNTWQDFDTLAGKFYSSNPNNAGGQAGCTQATPCTKAQLLALFPNVGIFGGANAPFQGGLYLRAGGPYAGGMVANADNLVVGVNGNTTTFDFEPSPPTLSIGNATVTEGNSGTTAATFTITQSVVSQLATTVTINTADGSATTANNDYQPIVNGTATIPAGQTSTTVTVNVVGDTNVEGNETFTVTLSNAVNASITDPQGLGTINNDDVTVSFSSPTYSIGEAGGTATITVTRNGVTPNPVSVNYATSSGSATGGAACTTGVDFINTSGTLTFAGNATTQTFTVTICDDNISEPPPAGETVNLTLSNPTGGATLGTAAAVLTIIDNDGSGLVTISGNVQMNNAPAANTNLQGVTVTLSGSSSGTTTTDQNGNYSFTGLTAGGSYKVTPSGLGKIYDPIYRNYASLNVNVTNANFLAYNSINDVPRRVRFGLTTVSPGNQVTVPVLLDALGNENGVSFSFTYDTTKLSNPVVTLGADAAGATLITNLGTPGSVGVTLAAPSGQTFGAAGAKRIVNVQFNTAANTSPNTPLTFTNAPITRSVNDVNANPLQSQFANGVVVFSQGLEADVDPRPNGDGDVDVGDFILVGQMAAGLTTADYATTNELQRADCEPTASKGDGDVDLGDFIQAGRYAAVLDPTQSVGGPAYPMGLPRPASLEKLMGKPVIQAVPRTVSVINANGSPGNQVTVSLEINPENGDKGVSFTLNYDVNVLSNPQVALGNGAQNATLVPNTNNPGQIIVQLAYITGGFQAGASQLVTVKFNVAANAQPSLSPLTFSDTPVQRQVRDTNNLIVASTFTNGTVNILGTTAAGASVGGKVLTAKGGAISQATVTLTGSNGQIRSATTNSFGNFRFEDVPAGETYIVNVKSKLYFFAPQVVSLKDNVSDLKFTPSN